MKIKVNREFCAGHALCAAKAPDVYELDEEGYCASDGKQVDPTLVEQARLGAYFCPERAITLIEDETPEE